MPLTRRDLVLVQENVQRGIDNKLSELANTFTSKLTFSVEEAMKKLLPVPPQPGTSNSPQHRDLPAEDGGNAADNEMDADVNTRQMRLPKNHRQREQRSKLHCEFKVRNVPQ